MDMLRKDPAAVVDVERDWSEWLPEGDSVTDSTWFVTPEGELTTASPGLDGARARTRIAAGVAESDYWLTNRITTAGGLVDERSILVEVRER